MFGVAKGDFKIMEIKDIGSKELKALNLYPLKYFYQLKTCLEYGYCEVYVRKENRFSIYERRIIPENRHGRVNLDMPDPEYWVLDRKFEIKDFNSMKTEELSCIMVSASYLSKIIWLRKYLNGEINGIYSKIEDSTFQDITANKEILKKDETITDLKLKIFKTKKTSLFNS